MPILEITGIQGRHRATVEVSSDTWRHRSGSRIGVSRQGHWRRGRDLTFWDRAPNGSVGVFAFALYEMNPAALLGSLGPGMGGKGVVAWDYHHPRQFMQWRVL